MDGVEIMSEGSISDKHINERQIVVFNLGEEEFGVDIKEVREIIRLEEITTIPNAQGFIEGVINLRGKIIVVIDLATKLGMPLSEHTKNTKIIIIERNELSVGMVVDSATEVLHLALEDIKPAPELIKQKLKGDYIEGVGILGERLLILLNLNQVLQTDDLEQIQKIKKEKPVITPNTSSQVNPSTESKHEQQPEPQQPRGQEQQHQPEQQQNSDSQENNQEGNQENKPENVQENLEHQ